MRRDYIAFLRCSRVLSETHWIILCVSWTANIGFANRIPQAATLDVGLLSVIFILFFYILFVCFTFCAGVSSSSCWTSILRRHETYLQLRKEKEKCTINFEINFISCCAYNGNIQFVRERCTRIVKRKYKLRIAFCILHGSGWGMGRKYSI